MRLQKLCAGLMLSSALSSAAYAQGTLSQGAAKSAETGEIIVTARKVKEDIRQVPFSISAVGGEQLQKQQVSTLEDLSRAIPNVSFNAKGGPGNSTIEIRGVQSDRNSPTVAVYLDDTSLAIRSLGGGYGQTEPRLFDISRIEVLRGPQGTLYGASAMGGLLRYISNPVNLNGIEGSVYGDVSTIDKGGANYTLRGVINVPLVNDKLGLRVGYEHFRAGGFVDLYDADNPTTRLDKDIDRGYGNVIKATLLFQPTETLSIKPSVLYQNVYFNDMSAVDIGTGLPSKLATAKRVREYGRDEVFAPSLTIDYDAGFADFTSVTTRLERRYNRVTDGTFYNSEFIGYIFDAGDVRGLDGELHGSEIGALPGPVYVWTTIKQTSQEFRLSSKPYEEGGFPLTWVIGGYYSDQKVSQPSDQLIPGFNDLVTSVYGAAVLDSEMGGPLPHDSVFDVFQGYKEKQYAVFGDVTFYLTPRLRLSAGARYSRSKQAARTDLDGYFVGNVPSSEILKSKANATTPRASISWDATKNATVYATVSKGFRLGGPNPPIPPGICDADLANLGYSSPPRSFGPDKVWNYEGGVKAHSSDRRVRISASGFYIQWSGIQQPVSLPCTFGFTGNLGKAESYGGEAEASFRVSDALTLAASGSVTHAVLTNDLPALGIAKGADIIGVPKWNLTASFDVTQPLSDDITGLLRGNVAAVGKSKGDFSSSSPDHNRPSYTLVGASIGAEYRGWEALLFVKNLTNTAKVIQRPSYNYLPRGYTLQPRTIGISVSHNF